jgi:hypothetical protein
MVICVALGCTRGRSAGRPFCRRHYSKLPERLRDDAVLATVEGQREAVVHLGKLDGYLAEVPESEVVIGDAGTPREWV